MILLPTVFRCLEAEVCEEFLIIAIVVVVVGGGLLVMRQRSQAQSTSSDTETQILDQTTAEVGDLRLTVNATGGVTPKRQVPLLFASPGVVEQVLVKAGDQVKSGDELAQLDTTDLQAAYNDSQVQLQIQQIAYDALTNPPRQADLVLAQAAVTAAQAALNAAYSSERPECRAGRAATERSGAQSTVAGAASARYFVTRSGVLAGCFRSDS